MIKINTTTILLLSTILLGGALWFSYSKYTDLESRLANETQNKMALADSLRVSKNKVGDLVYSKNILIADNDELKNLNASLSKSVEELDGKVLELTETVFVLSSELDTIYNNKLVEHSENTYGIEWETSSDFGNNNTRFLSGVTNFRVNTDPLEITPLNTIITRDYLSFSVLQGLRQRGGLIESFGTTKYPGIRIAKQDGAIVDPKNHPLSSYVKSKFTWGIHFGYGITYNPRKNMTLNGVQFGIGINYKPF